MSSLFGPPPGSVPQQAPPPPPSPQHMVTAGGDQFGDIFGGPAPSPVRPAPLPASQMQMQPQRPQLSQRDMSLSDVFGATAPGTQTPASTPAAGGDFFGGVFDSAGPPVPAIASNPWNAPAPAEPSTALVVSSAVDDDPFGLFGAPTPTSVAPDQDSINLLAGTGVPSGGPTGISIDPTEQPSAAPRGEGGLPPGGEFYDAKIFTPTLGVMFFKPQELVDSLFLQTDRDLVTALDDLPVVAFIVEGSSARSAGVELGHVLLKVNGIDVKNPKEASRLIKEGPRPLPLLFYVPDNTIVVAEGEHMVKYDTRETCAPASSKDWKPKYVVVGGIIAQSWMLNMYRSKVRIYMVTGDQFARENDVFVVLSESHRTELFSCLLFTCISLNTILQLLKLKLVVPCL